MNSPLPWSQLYRLSGAGNDFLATSGTATEIDPRWVSRLCRRGVGLGADGFFLLEPTGARRARMHHWNPDGSRAELCANGTRCAVRLARELGWIAEGEWFELETDSGTAWGTLESEPGQARVRYPWTVDAPRELALVEGPAWYVRMGVPHLILVTGEALATAPVQSQGPALRRHPALGPEGANVSWVRCPDSTTLEIRTYERGVEAETLACGSAVLAALVVGQELGFLGPSVMARVAGGFPLRARRSLSTSALELAGDARLLARIDLLTDLELPLPESPFSDAGDST